MIAETSMDFLAPTAPEIAQRYMPENTESFTEGMLYVVKTAFSELQPELADSVKICISLIAVVLIINILQSFAKHNYGVIQLTGCVLIGIFLLEPLTSMINLATQTVFELSEYGKLILPVMTAALAAQGGGSSSAALYAGTAFFDAVLSKGIVKLTVPLLYVFLAFGIAESAIGLDILKKIRDFVKWLMTWSIKIILYAFTGYLSITRVITGVVDSSALKATKLTISGMVPVVGGIISEASDTILVSAALMKNAAGIYGIIAVFAICINPFIKIGTLYLLLKITTAICSVFGSKQSVSLVQDFTTGMGFVLAMTGTVCMLLLISLVCYIKGIGG